MFTFLKKVHIKSPIVLACLHFFNTYYPECISHSDAFWWIFKNISMCLDTGLRNCRVFMHIKARLLFRLYIFCLHVALRKRYFGSCNGMMRHCREIGLWIFVMDKSQCRRSSEYYASSITKMILAMTSQLEESGQLWFRHSAVWHHYSLVCRNGRHLCPKFTQVGRLFLWQLLT